MRIAFRTSEDLPRGVAAAVIEGCGEVVVLIDKTATVEQVTAALDELIDPWAQEAWLYVGAVDLRAVG